MMQSKSILLIVIMPFIIVGCTPSAMNTVIRQDDGFRIGLTGSEFHDLTIASQLRQIDNIDIIPTPDLSVYKDFTLNHISNLMTLYSDSTRTNMSEELIKKVALSVESSLDKPTIDKPFITVEIPNSGEKATTLVLFCFQLTNHRLMELISYDAAWFAEHQLDASSMGALLGGGTTPEEVRKLAFSRVKDFIYQIDADENLARKVFP